MPAAGARGRRPWGALARGAALVLAVATFCAAAVAARYVGGDGRLGTRAPVGDPAVPRLDHHVHATRSALHRRHA